MPISLKLVIGAITVLAFSRMLIGAADYIALRKLCLGPRGAFLVLASCSIWDMFICGICVYMMALIW